MIDFNDIRVGDWVKATRTDDESGDRITYEFTVTSRGEGWIGGSALTFVFDHDWTSEIIEVRKAEIQPVAGGTYVLKAKNTEPIIREYDGAFWHEPMRKDFRLYDDAVRKSRSGLKIVRRVSIVDYEE